MPRSGSGNAFSTLAVLRMTFARIPLRVALTALKFFQKVIAIDFHFDNLRFPRRPQGRQDSMFANR
jgi:hypothetical protein